MIRNRRIDVYGINFWIFQQLVIGGISFFYTKGIGKFIQPVFAPAGFDWKITVSVISSFPAREVIIATLGIIYNLGGDVAEDDFIGGHGPEDGGVVRRRTAGVVADQPDT